MNKLPIKPSTKPAQQLMAMWHAEQLEEPLVRGKVFTYTSRLLSLGLVVAHEDSLSVTLTDEGRALAKTLSKTSEGKLFVEWLSSSETNERIYAA